VTKFWEKSNIKFLLTLADPNNETVYRLNQCKITNIKQRKGLTMCS